MPRWLRWVVLIVLVVWISGNAAAHGAEVHQWINSFFAFVHGAAGN